MNRILPFLVYTAFSFVCLGCKNQLSKNELIQYITDQDNGLIKTNEVGNVKTEIRYRPTDQMIWQELKNSEVINDSLIESKRKLYGKYHYFIMSISAGEKDLLHSGSNSYSQFSENLSKLSFRMREYTWMKADKDTIYLSDCQFPRLYGMTGSTQVLLVFEKPEKEIKEMEIVLDDFGIGIGKQSFKFETSDIRDIPELIFSKK